MDYKVTRNQQQTGQWFDTPISAYLWLNKQLSRERSLGYPQVADYRVYYNPMGIEVDQNGVEITTRS